MKHWIACAAVYALLIGGALAQSLVLPGPGLTVASGGGGGIAQVQKNGGAVNGNANLVTSLGSATTSGHTILIFVNDAGTIATPSGFTSVSPQVSAQGFYLFEKLVASGNSTDTPTLVTGGAFNGIWFIAEYSGITARDTSNGNNAALAVITSYTSASITPTAGARLLVASIGGTAGGFADTYNAADPQGWTSSFVGQQSLQQPGVSGAGRDSIMSGWSAQSVTASGSTAFSTTATFTESGGGPTAGASIIAAYK